MRGSMSQKMTRFVKVTLAIEPSIFPQKKSEIPIRNKVTNFQKIETMAAKKNKFTINLKSPSILKNKSLKMFCISFWGHSIPFGDSSILYKKAL